jgi:hypothetical protein
MLLFGLFERECFVRQGTTLVVPKAGRQGTTSVVPKTGSVNAALAAEVLVFTFLHELERFASKSFCFADCRFTD